ncbi:MAG: hypothetical protein MUF00_12700 [Gemmatimonadaceae bacterium]|jgi:hypothetical protein|nr:hypothetical protein [Gemmatimonadaceae bacterium]
MLLSNCMLGVYVVTTSTGTRAFSQSAPSRRSSTRSLEREYQAYLQFEIEEYKNSISRGALLRIADEAARAMADQPQIALTELVLGDEVDRLIAKRLKLQSFRTWKQRALKRAEALRKPEHWGLTADAPVVRAVPAVELAAVTHVLVAGGGERQHGPALFLAAQGFAVTTLDTDYDAVERVMHAAEAHGLDENVRGFVGLLEQWSPDVRFQAVVCAADAVLDIESGERGRVLDALQRATVEGGVHLFESAESGEREDAAEALQASYAGWSVAVESRGGSRLLFARKGVAA